VGRAITEPISITIPVRPITKKNSQRWVKAKGGDLWRLIPSEAYVQYERDCAPFIRVKGLEIDSLVNMRCLFYIDADRKSDASNYYEAIADILVHYHVIVDDNRKIIRSWDGSRVLVDRKNPRTEITIEPVYEPEPQLAMSEAELSLDQI
jgi:Holliday junction resolvase RusA-like endonuclease